MNLIVATRRSFGWTAVILLLTGLHGTSSADEAKTMAEMTQGMTHATGLIDAYVDPAASKIYLALPAPHDGSLGQYIYYDALRSGLGSNPVGLDRAQLGNTRLVEFRLIGGRVFLEEPNMRFRALSEDLAEREATRESFASSILWATDVAARGAAGEVLIDFSGFLLRDEHGIAWTLKNAEQGDFSKDGDRSFLDTEAFLALPRNLEFESILTFKSSKPGGEVQATTPDPESVTLRVHHSLIELPEAGYSPRRLDPRVGAFAMDFADYAAPLDQTIHNKWIIRHRLEKTDPAAARSRVKEPIVYYVDRGAPEPVRSALLDGARWWAEAFEAAGFIDAYRVELLPEGVHPLDIRYNVINWVHRATRGWSYGWGVMDPRTGEMLKGHVVLGSLRVRQDRLLFEGLAGADRTGSGAADDPVQLALARIRQLAAHEVGHTLGIAHNFAASTYGRESVMDYPAPLVTVKDGALDFSDVYGVGIGTWDKHAIRYVYSQFAPGTDEDEALGRIVQDGLRAGLHFISDADARPSSAANPRGNLWDNGDTAEQGLEQILGVRQIAMRNFGEDRIAMDRPKALLGEVYAPIYFMHRYAVDAAAKVLGGYDYNYSVRGDGQTELKPMPRDRQARALDLLLDTLEPAALDIPEETLQMLLPRPFGFGRNRELIASRTSPVFDAVGAAETAARMTASRIYQAARCARLIDQHRRDASLPSFEEIQREVTDRVFAADGGSDRVREIRRATQRAVVDVMLGLAAQVNASPSVRGQTELALQQLHARLKKQRPDGFEATAHRNALLATLQRFFDRATDYERPDHASAPPPGSPIGSASRRHGDREGMRRQVQEASVSDGLPNFGECSWRP